MQSPHIIPLTPALVVAAANTFIGLVEEGGENRGQLIERFLEGVNQPPGEAWCAAFVHHVGFYAHYDHVLKASSWPLPATASCYELGRFAARRGILEREPNVGDVFLKYDPKLGRFAHTGIVVGVDSDNPQAELGIHRCATVEGNTNDNGSANGNAVLRKDRPFSEPKGDRFIRWIKLERRAMAA